MGTTEVPSCSPQSFPVQGDKENIEGKEVSDIRTAHHKHLNKGNLVLDCWDVVEIFPY